MKHPFTASSLTVPFIGARVVGTRLAGALVLMVLGLLGSGWGSAQTLPGDYRRATDALTESMSVFAADPVASLDALRQAERAFVPLSQGLEPGLREGLRATFARAEEAIVNRSETDLRVQTAVLRGGFGRALYRQTLSEAAVGNLARARSLLGVLAGDLGFDRQTFAGDTQRTLQAAFERRLAARSLAELDALGQSREARYRTLAQLYGYIFLVQDSPRLPAQTQTTLVAAIQQLVAGEALEPSLETLRAQLERFAEAAAASSRSRPTGAVVADPETPDSENVVAPVPDPEAEATGPDNRANDGTAATASGAANSLNAAASRTRTGPEQAAAQAETPTEMPTPATPAPDGAPLPQNTPTAASADPATSLVGELRPPLLIGAGLLALVALGRLLGSLRGARTPARTPWQDAALALLLLPALAEGLIRLVVVLAPSFNVPYLSALGSYSLFRNPVTQLLWAGLVILAVLCLALGWRTTTRTVTEKPTAPQSPSQPPSQPASRPLTSVSTLNWDEDF
jgi:hypothetical protein